MALSHDLDRLLVEEQGLYGFVKAAWPIVQSTDYEDNWHIRVIANRYQEVSEAPHGDRVILNIPPACMKSLLTCVFWPAWEWIHRPATCFMFASFDQRLVNDSAKKVIDIITSDWYRSIWGDRLRKGSRAISMVESDDRGFIFTTSVKGKGTGRHGHIRIIDDPTKPANASITSADLEGTNRWHGSTWISRVKDPTKIKEVVIMQRLHEDDLSGHLLKSGRYDHLCFPMRFDAARANRLDPRRAPGELLWPKRYPVEAVRTLEEDAGPIVAAAQYGQSPHAEGGSIFAFDKWGTKYWAPSSEAARLKCRALPKGGTIYQSWDLAFKKTEGSDFVSGGVWLVHENDFYLLRIINERMSFTESVGAVQETSREFPDGYTKLIEDKANGPAVEDQLKDQIPGLTLVPPAGGKLSRAHACTRFFKAGRVFLPHYEIDPKVVGYLAQLRVFPRGRNDDMVDMTSQFLNYIGRDGDAFSVAMERLRSGNV